MLSILIPIYNYDVRKLVRELHRQAEEQMIDFEILALEDGSTQFLMENRELTKLPNCLYECRGVNVGRAVIRNLLAAKATYNHLLFLDCDSDIPTPHFIETYMTFIKEDIIVLGGRIYQEKVAPKYSLLKKYGAKRERNNSSNMKGKTIYPMFTTPNFMIPKKAFESVKFNEKMTNYGHEDSIFGLELRRKGFNYTFIDNPVVHVGLDTNQAFLKKTREALDNLYSIYLSKEYSEIEKESKILKTYIKLKRLRGVFSLLYSFFHKIMEMNLISKNPNLFIFDFYKLTYLCYHATSK